MSENKEIVEVKNEAENSTESLKGKTKTTKKTSSRSTNKKITKKIKDMQESIKISNQERDEFKEKYLRNLAEIDNFRKRLQKEKSEYQKYVLSEFLLELLQITDNLERALKTKEDSSDEKSIISGVEMIYKQMVTLLNKYQVFEIESLDKPFDPLYHQAIAKIEQEEVDDPLVIEVYQKGYLYHNKLLRPAFVKVAVPPLSKSGKVEEE